MDEQRTVDVREKLQKASAIESLLVSMEKAIRSIAVANRMIEESSTIDSFQERKAAVLDRLLYSEHLASLIKDIVTVKSDLNERETAVRETSAEYSRRSNTAAFLS